MNLGQVLGSVGGPLSGTVSGLLSLILTVLLFVLVYRYLPLAPVLWRDATFGAILAAILFESMKYLFFWVGSIAIERSILYGPLSSGRNPFGLGLPGRVHIPICGHVG